jgi:hypothetical protein
MVQAKDKKDLARQVMLDSFPAECAAAGPSVVNDALDGVDVEVPAEGRPFPLHEIFQFLKDLAELLLALIPIIKLLWDTHKRKPTPAEVEAEAKKKGVGHGKLKPEQVEKAVKGLLKGIKDIDELVG